MAGNAVVELPGQRQLVTTWGIPVEYAGQTTATLRRVGQQIQRSGRPVELLTFDGARDVGEMTAQLRARGSWTDGLVLRNAFEDLRSWDAEGTLVERLADRPDAPEAERLEVVAAREDRTRWCTRGYDDEGRLGHAEMYRADGSLLARDFPVQVEGRRRRHQEFFALDGTPLRRLQWFDAYFAWLDTLLGEDEAVVVNESKTTARFVSRYANPRVTLVHVFHESHLADPTDPYTGPLLEQHRRILPHLDRWEAAVFLTRLQRDDVARRFGESGHLHSVPNAGPSAAPRPRGLLGEPGRADRGVVMSRLAPGKRIPHAVEAVDRVRRAGGPGRRVTLDVYGQDAGAQAAVEQAVRDTGSAAYVALRGYTSDAPGRFAHASFTLMTSRSEGQSLVLLESMAQGCVPISYDIRYGPAELVVDGETGFLVPDGDVDALADTITRFLALPGREVRRLREAGRERLAAFSDEEAYRRWVEVQHDALRLRAFRGELVGVTVAEAAFFVEEPLLRIDARLTYEHEAGPGASPVATPPAARLLLVGRRGGRPWRRNLAVTEHAPGSVTVTGDFDPAAAAVGRKVSDVFLELQQGTSVRRVRLAGLEDVGTESARLFTTANGNLSLRRT
jgi:poly(glycerol-phosphate) alpha-glucosyltransferase